MRVSVESPACNMPIRSIDMCMCVRLLPFWPVSELLKSWVWGLGMRGSMPLAQGRGGEPQEEQGSCNRDNASACAHTTPAEPIVVTVPLQAAPDWGLGLHTAVPPMRRWRPSAGGGRRLAAYHFLTSSPTNPAAGSRHEQQA